MEQSSTVFEMVIFAGAVLTALGIIGIVMFIVKVRAAQKEQREDEVLKARLGALMPLNLGSFLVSAIGLMMVVMGVILG
ncbi:MAG: hypothetical protein ACPG6L_11255 [Nereida ignava]